jgi:ribonucleoside-diphosphate reductase alpha chain
MSSATSNSLKFGPQRKTPDTIDIDLERNNLITGHGMETFNTSYLLPGENPQTLYARVCAWMGSNSEHAQRLYDYLSKHWFSPATPILSNAGTKRGQTISCYLTEVQDSMRSIIDKWQEQAWLASQGGGLGVSWRQVRSRSEKVGQVGSTSGVVPFLKVCESLTLAISQGSLRRGNAAMYLPIWHPEIIEFLNIRNPVGGDPKRKTLELHHGITIDDEFMKAVETNSTYNLRSPKDGSIIDIVKAREVWIRILTTRVETGEPYIIFIDNVNKAVPEHHQALGLFPTSSNLCSEILLPIGPDYNKKDRTAVCCLSSLNLEYWDEWKDNEQFIPDIMEFLDNILIEYCDTAIPEMQHAVYSARQERSVGLGVMGFHSLLQKKNLPWESALSKSLNMKVFKHLKLETDRSSKLLAELRGPCPDAVEYTCRTGKEYNERFSYKMAIAPTASISILTGQSSPGIEPNAANIFKFVIKAGTLIAKNKYLSELLDKYGMNTSEVWEDISQNKGSVRHLEFLTPYEKDIFKTATEIDQRWLVEFAADRTPFVDQGQSLNLFLPADINKKDLHNIHMMAWKKGVKSLYYVRSSSVQQAQTLDRVLKASKAETPSFNSDECLACQ